MRGILTQRGRWDKTLHRPLWRSPPAPTRSLRSARANVQIENERCHQPTHGEKKKLPWRHQSAQAFRRAGGVPARTRSCRTRAADGEVAPLPPEHLAEYPLQPPRPPALAASLARARAEPATPFLTGDNRQGWKCRCSTPMRYWRSKLREVHQLGADDKRPRFPWAENTPSQTAQISHGERTCAAQSTRQQTAAAQKRNPKARRPSPPLWSHGEATLLPLLAGRPAEAGLRQRSRSRNS